MDHAVCMVIPNNSLLWYEKLEDTNIRGGARDQSLTSKHVTNFLFDYEVVLQAGDDPIGDACRGEIHRVRTKLTVTPKGTSRVPFFRHA